MENNFFADYQERLDNLRHGLYLEIKDLPAEALDWVPGIEMNSVVVLLAHTAGSLRYWIGDVALRDPSGRVRESEFQTQGLPGTELLHRLDIVFDYLSSVLPRLHWDDLAQERRIGEDRVVSCAWALLHALEHGYLHLGHIQLTCQLLKQSGF